MSRQFMQNVISVQQIKALYIYKYKKLFPLFLFYWWLTLNFHYICKIFLSTGFMDISYLYSLFEKHPQVTTDSRNCLEGSIFFAIKGANFNGNRYAREAIAKGCAYAVVDEPEFADEKGGIMLTDNVLATLQRLANYHRRRFSIPVVGITGTNGKTTTKELIATVLKARYNVLYTEGNLNNHIGVPLTLLQLREEHEIAVIEMGANHPGEIAELCAIAEPTHGLITNVGKAHLEGFGSFENVIKTKSELYGFLSANSGTGFLDNENAILSGKADGLTAFKYGASADLFVTGRVVSNNPFLTMEWSVFDKQYKISTQLIGGYNSSNVLAAVCVGHYFEVPEQSIVEAIASYVPVNNRSQFKQTAHNRLIIDAYNANPSSMRAAIENFIGSMKTEKMVILGDMLELGESSKAEHNAIVELLKESGVEEALLCGKEFSSLSGNPYKTFENTDELVCFLSTSSIKGKEVLIKGSRGIQLERVVELL